MTRSGHTQASLTDLPASPAERPDEAGLADASRRAWTTEMTVRPFGDGYLVDCAGDTRYVSLGPSSCSCGGGTERAGDSVGAGGSDADSGADPCEHVRRVAIEINLGRVPPPSERTVECGECGRAVAVSAADSPPALCADCDLEPGALVVDVQGDADTPLLVVSEPGRPADVVAVPGDGRSVARCPDNGEYEPDTPVVEVVYPRAVSTDREPQRYLFPIARLRRPDRDPRPPEPDDARSATTPE